VRYRISYHISLLTLSIGKLFDLLLAISIDPETLQSFVQFSAGLLPGETIQACQEQQMLFHFHLGIEPAPFQQIAPMAAGYLANRYAVPGDPPRIGANEAVSLAQHGRE
jgi:hypothetical protein